MILDHKRGVTIYFFVPATRSILQFKQDAICFCKGDKFCAFKTALFTIKGHKRIKYKHFYIYFKPFQT